MPAPENHWKSDDYSQPEQDYSVGSNVSTPRKASGRCSSEANARKCKRWAGRNKAKRRDYMRLYMAARRSQDSSQEPDE